MKISRTSLIYHFLGLTILVAGSILSIGTTNYTPVTIGLSVCAILFIFGIEFDLYGEEATP